MAFREIRTYFEISDAEASPALHRELANPFTFYMDGVMRGRLREYGGPEVKGLNIVNLFLCERSALDLETDWHPMMNTYQRKVFFDFHRLRGSREERVGILIDVFASHAKHSSLPQMQTLLRHIKESKGRASIAESIERGDEQAKAVHERVRRK